jgi:hypothetical protein
VSTDRFCSFSKVRAEAETKIKARRNDRGGCPDTFKTSGGGGFLCAALGGVNRNMGLAPDYLAAPFWDKDFQGFDASAPCALRHRVGR